MVADALDDRARAGVAHREALAGRDCQLNSISDTDATLTVEGSIQGLNLKEFFLLLSSTGLAYRRCELVRVNGTEMDIRFLRGKHAKKRPGASSKAEEAMH